MAASDRNAWPRHFRKVACLLNRCYPLPLPVDVGVLPLKRIAGDCYRDGDRFVIRIARDSKWAMANALAEEWAHALTYDARKPHGREWALAYADCRAVTMEED